jgi:hypothetical protein
LACPSILSVSGSGVIDNSAAFIITESLSRLLAVVTPLAERGGRASEDNCAIVLVITAEAAAGEDDAILVL